MPLVQDGLRRSVTLRELAGDIEASDLRALVFFSHEPGVWRGDTIFVSAAGGIRIVSVKVNAALEKLEQLAVLGHELQHVREIVRAPDVVDPAGLRRLLESLGYQANPRSTSYETSAAQAIERQVRAELSRTRR